MRAERQSVAMLDGLQRRAVTTPGQSEVGPSREYVLHRLLSTVAARATSEGRTDSLYPGLCFYRVSRPSTFRKVRVLGPVFIVVVQGSKLARIGRRALRYDASQHLVLTGETRFDSTVVEASPERPYLALSIELPPDDVAKSLVALADAPAQSMPQPVPAFLAQSQPAILDAVARLLAAVDDPVEQHVLAPLAIQELVFRLLRTEDAAAVRSAVAPGDAVKIQRAMEFMRLRFARPLRVDDIARQVAMSPSHFAHRFRAVAGLSPMRYLRQIRLEQARLLMLESGARAAEAAMRVGYESASHFARDFKSRFGAPPAAYVRSLRHARPV